jgi:hypothetical protein
MLKINRAKGIVLKFLKPPNIKMIMNDFTPKLKVFGSQGPKLWFNSCLNSFPIRTPFKE